MTFIASVVAKKGVAIIADSLVTSQSSILYYRSFLEYIEAQPNNEQGEKVINSEEIRQLFSSEPIFTKDFEEKLFEINRYTALTTSGTAYINDKSISDLIEEFRFQNLDHIDDMAISIDEKISQFSDFIDQHARAQLQKYNYIGHCVFIVTYYEKHTHTTHIYKANIQEADLDALEDPDYKYLTVRKESDWVSVVFEGQNKISEKILYGAGIEIYRLFPELVTEIINKLNIQPENIPDHFIETLREEPFFYEIFYGDLELLNLNNLSLQQAVDLAALLMRLEVDFQRYTKNIPTVGGVIKLAVIDENGFRFISGHQIEVPKHINY